MTFGGDLDLLVALGKHLLSSLRKARSGQSWRDEMEAMAPQCGLRREPKVGGLDGSIPGTRPPIEEDRG